MMTENLQTSEVLKRYYKFHSKFYDITRWSFLFGRKRIITSYLPGNIHPDNILEVGCGTGKNLVVLQRKFPDAHLTGVDISTSMLEIAEKKTSGITLKEASYASETFDAESFDFILFSYSLSMMNPGWDSAIRNARQHLKTNGLIAVVDFYESALKPFKKWMGVNHVRMDSHLLPELNKQYHEVQCDIKKAYGGVWNYLLYLGRKEG